MLTGKRAILLSYSFYPTEGGIETFMRSMVTADIGISWTVLTRRADDVPDPEGEYDLVRTVMRPQLRLMDRLWLRTRRRRIALPELLAFQTRRRLTRLARQAKADFLFADQHCSAYSVRGAARTLGIPWGLGVYGKELLKDDPKKRSLLGDASLAVACSSFAARLAVSRGTRECNTRIVHPAIDTQRFCPPPDREQVRSQLGAHKRKVLLTVAHLVERKGHEQVIRSLPIVRSVCPDVIYLVVGRGPTEGVLRALAQELGVSEAIRFCGYVSERDLPLYYGAADIHVMPSTCDGDVEGFGISFIEAAACGTPSIGSRSGGIPDAIMEGKTGFLVEPGDVGELATRITALITNEDLCKQMATNAYQTAGTRFSGEAFAETLSSTFQHTVLAQ